MPSGPRTHRPARRCSPGRDRRRRAAACTGLARSVWRLAEARRPAPASRLAGAVTAAYYRRRICDQNALARSWSTAHSWSDWRRRTSAMAGWSSRRSPGAQCRGGPGPGAARRSAGAEFGRARADLHASPSATPLMPYRCDGAARTRGRPRTTTAGARDQPRRAAGAGSRPAAAAAAQVALELPGDRVAAGLRACALVALALLQRRGRTRRARRPRRRSRRRRCSHSSACSGRSASGTCDVEHLLDPVQQRQGRLRAGRL